MQRSLQRGLSGQQFPQPKNLPPERLREHIDLRFCKRHNGARLAIPVFDENGFVGGIALGGGKETVDQRFDGSNQSAVCLVVPPPDSRGAGVVQRQSLAECVRHQGAGVCAEDGIEPAGQGQFRLVERTIHAGHRRTHQRFGGDADCPGEHVEEMVRMAGVVEDIKATSGPFDRLQQLQHIVWPLVRCKIFAKHLGGTTPLDLLAIHGNRMREKLTDEQHHCHVKRLLERG